MNNLFLIILIIILPFFAYSDSSDNYGDSKTVRTYKEFNDALENELNTLKATYYNDLIKRYKNELEIYYLKKIMDQTAVVIKLKQEAEKILKNTSEDLQQIIQLNRKKVSSLNASNNTLAESISYNSKSNIVKLNAIKADLNLLRSQISETCMGDRVEYVASLYQPNLIYDSDIKKLFQFKIPDEHDEFLQYFYYITGPIFRGGNLKRLRKQIRRRHRLSNNIFNIKAQKINQLQGQIKDHIQKVCLKNKELMIKNISNGSQVSEILIFIKDTNWDLNLIETELEMISTKIEMKKNSIEIIRAKYYENLKMEFSIMVDEVFNKKENFKEDVKSFLVKNLSKPLNKFKLAKDFREKLSAFNEINNVVFTGDIKFLKNLNQLNIKNKNQHWLNIRASISKKVNELW